MTSLVSQASSRGIGSLCGRSPCLRVCGRFLPTMLLVVVAIPCFISGVLADEFTYFDREGNTQTVNARLAGSGQEFFALELADGQMILVPEGAVEKRVPGDDPEPLDADILAEKVRDAFGGEEQVVTYVEKPQVLIYVLHQATTDRKEIGKKLLLLKQAARFLKSMHGKFLNYVRYCRLDNEPLQFPLVVLIFEKDEDFEDYAREVTGNVGLSAGAIAGFYDSLTNYLVLRESECSTFEVPLHESIHQQVYNRRILQRLAPIPVWFNEGLATGFEGDGKVVRKGPGTVSERYGFLALNAREVTWEEIVRNDKAFQGDVLAGEAYGHAWGLHWLMVSKYRLEYTEYVKLLAQKTPLSVIDEDDRLEHLESIFEQSIGELHQEFEVSIQAALKKLKPRRSAQRMPHGRQHSFAALIGIEIPANDDHANGWNTSRSPVSFAAYRPREMRALNSNAATTKGLQDLSLPAISGVMRQPLRFDLARALRSDIDFSLPIEKRTRLRTVRR